MNDMSCWPQPSSADSCRRRLPAIRRFLAVLLVSLVLCAPSPLLAQAILSPQKSDELPFGVFTGYSGYRAGGTVNGVKVPDFTLGWAGQAIFKIGYGIGFVADVNVHHNDFASTYDVAVGPRYQFHIGPFRPFVELLAGVQHFSPKDLPSHNAPTYIGGAGMDVKVSPSVSIRPFQLSYVSTFYNAATPGSTKNNPFDGLRVQAGLIYQINGSALGAALSGMSTKQGEVSADCSATPESVDAGAPVKIRVTPKGFLPKRSLSYTYASTGGKIEGSTAIASVDTTGTAEGSYTVTASVMDNGKRKHQQSASASCQSTFTVKAAPAPASNATTSNTSRADTSNASTSTAATSTAPTSTAPTSTTATSTTATSTTATSTTATGGKSASASETHPQSPSGSAPTQITKFGDIGYQQAHPGRLEAEAKPELKRFAAALMASPNTKAVVVGHTTAREVAKQKRHQLAYLATRRAMSAKDYLKTEGIAPARIELRTAHGKKTTDLWIAPAGATVPGSKPVNEAKIRVYFRQVQKRQREQKRRNTHEPPTSQR